MTSLLAVGGILVALCGFLVWLYRQGGKGKLADIRDEEVKKQKQIRDDWREIDEKSKKNSDRDLDDPGTRWE